MPNNILTERLIRMDKSDGSRVAASLPEVYAALMADEVEAFPALRPHQRHALHAFLVQLGAMAMHEAGLTEPPVVSGHWRRIIRGLTPGWPCDEPWQLVVCDITKPAFMQPPASSKELEKDYKNSVGTPDELDMLVTSKNHDVKSEVAGEVQTDDWAFVIITLQTMAGYDGAGNYGISRMPSGYGNRSAFSLTASISAGGHVRHDIVALLQHREEMLNDIAYLADSGKDLLWVETWDGTEKEAIAGGLDPFYIEVCRRIRLVKRGGTLQSIRAPSKRRGRRAIDMKGLTGDPWQPVGINTNPRGTPPAFLGPRKFGYERVVDGLTSPDWKPPYLLRPLQSERDKEMLLVARGMIRGEGGTSGYHERTIPLKPKVVRVFGRGGGLEELGDIARERIEQVGKVKNILRHAIATFAANGDSDFGAHRNGQPSPNQLAQPWANRLDEIVDARFFEHLQDEFEEDASERDDVRKQWLRNGNDGVIDEAEKVLSAAQDALPCLSVQKFKARVRADSIFWGRLRGNEGLPSLFDSQEEEETWENSDQTTQERNPTEGQMTLFE